MIDTMVKNVHKYKDKKKSIKYFYVYMNGLLRKFGIR